MFGAPGFYGWDASGGTMPGWPVNPDFLECSPVVFGVEGGGDMGVMIASNTTPGALYAYTVDGTLIEGFPVATPAAALPNSPAVADVDLDKNMEIALFTMDGSVSLWTTDENHHPHTIIDWGCWFHDNWHTGWLHPAAPTGLTVARGNPGARLYWNRNREPDVKGYYVFRVGVSGWFERLMAQPIQDTTYLDTTALGDTTRYYRVSAVIRAGNESRQSDGVFFNPTGVEESERWEVRSEHGEATVVNGVLVLPDLGHDPDSPGGIGSCPASLLDISGRRVMDIRAGANDVSRLAPGAYFVRRGSTTARFVLCR